MVHGDSGIGGAKTVIDGAGAKTVIVDLFNIWWSRIFCPAWCNGQSDIDEDPKECIWLFQNYNAYIYKSGNIWSKIL